MSDLTAKFTALEEQIATEHTEAQATREAINTRLDEFSATFDTLIENNAVNTRLILSALGQIDPCKACPTPPLIIPPIGTTPIPIDTEGCQRAQAFVQFMTEAFTVLDLASSVGVGFTPSLVADAFAQVIASIGGTDSPNVISFPEAVQLVGDLINYIVLNLLRGATLSESFSPLSSDIRDATYASGAPDVARTAYNAIISGSALDSDIKTVLIDAAYSDVYSYFFDSTSLPDLSGYDGGACSFPAGTCFEFDDTTSISDGASTAHALGGTFGPFEPVSGAVNTSSGPVVWTPGIFYGVNPTGWTFEVLTGHANVLYRAGGVGDSGSFTNGTSFGVDATPHAFPSAGTWALIMDSGGRVRVCST